MKRAQTLAWLLVLPLTCLAQRLDPTKNEGNSWIAIARCQYTPADGACTQPESSRQPSASNRHHSPGQCHRASCAQDSECCPVYSPPSVRPPFVFEPESGSHAVAGALIGFGIMASVGAAADGNGGPRLGRALIAGTLGAVVGGFIGHAIPAHRFRWHHPSDEDLEDDLTNRCPTRDCPKPKTLIPSAVAVRQATERENPASP